MEGTWTGKSNMGDEETTITYKVTAGGSAVVETIEPGKPYEMISVYHMDGDDLVMTHYCAAQNQPFLKFKAGNSKNSFTFEFVRGSNMKPSDMHMHSVEFTFDGNDHCVSNWGSMADGKPGMSAKFDMRRVK